MLKYELSAKASGIHGELVEEVKKCEALRIAGQAYAGKDEQFGICVKKANELNKAMTEELVAAYVAMAESDGAEAVMRDYMGNWFFTGYKVSQHDSESGGDVYVESANVRIPLSAIDTASKKVKLTRNGAWRKYLTIFIDNCVRFDSTNEKGVDGKTETAAFTKDALPADLLKLRKEHTDSKPMVCGKVVNWNSCTKADLHLQLNDLVNNMILPESMFILMTKADVRSILKATADLKKATSMATSGMGFTAKNGKATETILFRQIHTRKNGLAIHTDMGYKAKEANGQPAPTPEAGEVSTPAADAVPVEK